MSPSLPLEFRYLIIDEIWSSEPRGTTLSSLNLAWKDAIPFIRAHRFKSVEISSDKVLADFLDITDGAPEIFTVIHSMEIMFPSDEIGCNPAIHLISNAVNLEHLTLRSFRMDWDYTEALRVCARLTTLSLIHVHVKRVCDVFRVLSCVPHLTTLYLHRPHIGELMSQHRNIARPPVGWHFEAPRPIPQISSLSLDIGSSEISLLDLISSSMTPFPELREISFSDVGIRGYGPHRLPALLVRYHSSLRVLDLRSELVMDLKILAFPPYVEHLKFDVYCYTSLKPFCDLLLLGRASVRIVTLRLNYGSLSDVLKFGLPEDVGLLDDVLAGMDLKCLNEEIVSEGSEKFDRLMEECLNGPFRRCSKLHTEGRLTRCIRWVSPE